MPWVVVRNVCIPILPAILCLAASGSFLEQPAKADGDVPVVAPKPTATVDALKPVISASDVAAQAEVLLAAADETKPEESKPAETKDAKADESQPAEAKKDDAKKDEGKGKHKAGRKRPDPEEVFKKWDANNDGAISKDEFKAAMTKMHERFAKMRGHHRRHGFGKGFPGRRWMGMHGGPGRHRGFGMWGHRGGPRGPIAMNFHFGRHGGPGHFRHGGPWGRGRHTMRDHDRDRGPSGDRGPGGDRRPPEGKAPGGDRIEKLEKQIQELKKTVEQLAKPEKA